MPKRTSPSRDPDSPKYTDDPNRAWYAGRWQTREQIERKLERHREWHREKYANDPNFRERVLRRTYWDLDGLRYSKKLLVNRRYKALGRMAERNERRAATFNGEAS